MGLLDIFPAVKRLKAQVSTLQLTTTSDQISNFTQQIFPSWTVWKDIEAYRIMDDLYSVVTRLARTSAMIPFYAYDIATGEYVPNSDKLWLFLQKFNFKEKIKLYTYLYLTGECFMYLEKIDLGVNAGVSKFHFLTPSNVSLVLSRGFPEEIVAYRYIDTLRQVDVTIAVEDMIFMKYFNPTSSYVDSWRGLSPVKALAERLTRLQSGLDASVAQMQNGGVPGIVYEKDPTISSESLNAAKSNFSNYLRNSNNKGAPFFSGGDLGYIQLGLKLTDLDVAELGKIDFKKICNAYGISDILFNSDSGSTESNVKEMVRLMYTNAILPNVMMVRDDFNNELVPLFPGKPKEIRYDLSSITELQEDMLARANAYASQPFIIPNQMFEGMGEQTVDNPDMNEVWVKSGYTMTKDMNLIEDTLNDGNIN